MPSTLSVLLLVQLFILSVFSQSSDAADYGYIGYSLEQRGDPESAIYDTASTAANATLDAPPDVSLNASVHVGEISILVKNLEAKVNLDAKVLQLLQFNAGVQANVSTVKLLIQNVTAHATLEARLGNLVAMIANVLESLDLNPVLATLGDAVSTIVDALPTSPTPSPSSSLTPRSITESWPFKLANNILYSANDYTGRTHTNRILAQNGSIVDQYLDNEGVVSKEIEVGHYSRDMTFNGVNRTATFPGQADRELEYLYQPYPGLTAICMIYLNLEAKVVGAQVLSETVGGGSSTVAEKQ